MQSAAQSSGTWQRPYSASHETARRDSSTLLLEVVRNQQRRGFEPIEMLQRPSTLLRRFDAGMLCGSVRACPQRLSGRRSESCSSLSASSTARRAFDWCKCGRTGIPPTSSLLMTEARALEVTYAFRDRKVIHAGRKPGSQTKEAESTCLKFLGRLAAAHYARGGSPLQVHAIVSDGFSCDERLLLDRLQAERPSEQLKRADFAFEPKTTIRSKSPSSGWV